MMFARISGKVYTMKEFFWATALSAIMDISSRALSIPLSMGS
jgi:hypothetical protein